MLVDTVHLASGHTSVLGLANFLSLATICTKNFCSEFHFIYKLQGVSSHGKPGKVVEFNFLFPGLEKSWKLTPGFGKFIKVMEIKRHPFAKRHCSFLSSSISIQGYVFVIRSNFGVFHVFLYCDWNLVSGSQKQNWRKLVASAGASDHGGSS